MQPAATKTEALLSLARKGPVRARDLASAGIPRAYLARLCKRGLLEQVDRGLYRLTDAPVTELHSLAEVGKRVPHAIVCLLSALQVHGLTTEVPHAVWVLIDRNARMPKLAYPSLQVVRASGAALEHAVESRKIEHVVVHVTSPAKTVADCFRYRRHVGLDVAPRFSAAKTVRTSCFKCLIVCLLMPAFLHCSRVTIAHQPCDAR